MNEPAILLDAEAGGALAADAETLAVLHDREVTPELLRELRQIRFPANLALLPQSDGTREAHAGMARALAALPAAPGQDVLDELAADFASIYLTGGHGASPCESFWLDEEHLTCQAPMFELRALYAGDGIAVPDWRKRADDHLVFQLRFLALRLTGANGDAGWRNIASFLDRHLLRWLPAFARAVHTRCRTDFYAALAVLTAMWCEDVRECIAAHLGEPRPAPENAGFRQCQPTAGDPSPIRLHP